MTSRGAWGDGPSGRDFEAGWHGSSPAGPPGVSSPSPDAVPGRDPRDQLPRVLTLTDASMLIVASVVGAGIFLTPGQVATLLPSATWILLAWSVGALLSLAGALANAELSAMFPRAGGDYVYLREGLHPAAGFLVGWLSFFAIYAGTIAALAVVLGEAAASYCVDVGLGGALSQDVVRLGAAALVILACSALNVFGVRWGARVTNLTSAFKIAALLLFVLLGFSMGEGSFAAWRDAGALIAVAPGEGGVTQPLWLRFGSALSPVLFSFLGWNASVYVASEVRDAERNVPRSLFLGLSICAALYLAVNAVYFFALSPPELQSAGNAGEAAARALFASRIGPAVGQWVAAFVLVSVLGTLNATILAGPRVAYAMALDGLFWGPTDRVHAGFQTPSVAIWVQATIAIALVAFLENFPSALDFTVFAIVLATTADVVALFCLRVRRPEWPRPVRAWGYPWVPALYILVNVAVAISLILSQPRECAIAAGLLALGLLVYCFLFRGGRSRPEQRRGV